MFKYGTFSGLLLGGGKTKKDGASAIEREQQQQQPGESSSITPSSSSPSTDASPAPPAAAAAAAGATSSKASANSKCVRISLVVMLSSGVILAVGLLGGLLTNRARGAPDTPPSGSLNSTGRPNIIMIMTDDQDRRLGSTDYMTSLHRLLIDQGTEFTNHYTTQALCCPARSSFLRGQQVHNTNITNVVKPGYDMMIL